MLKRNLAGYLLTLLVGLAGASTAYYVAKARLLPPSMVHETLSRKERFYRQHAAEYDLAFIGDSRTYCGFHPESLDHRLGRKSINLATFALWFPTQLPFVQKIVRVLPHGMPVVWAIGNRNFFPLGDGSDSVSDRYPIGWRNAAWYLRLGFRPSPVAANLLTYLPFTSLLSEARQILDVIRMRLETPLFVRAGASRDAGLEASLPAREAELLEHYQSLPEVGRANVVSEGARITSVILYRNGGGYLRIELDPPFFREKQRERQQRAGGPLTDAEAEAFDTGEADPRFLALFEAILTEFEAAHVPLIVVEMEEAPFLYRHEKVREKWRGFMDRVARSRVEARGFTYIRPDFSSIVSEDYFDYNHLNSIGVEKFSEMLAPLLTAKLPATASETGLDAVQLP